MSKYLLNNKMKFRADSEMEANQIVTHFKSKTDVKDHRVIRKDKKDETYFIVEITIQENLEKDPFTSYTLE